jgi:hypothetical protein
MNRQDAKAAKRSGDKVIAIRQWEDWTNVYPTLNALPRSIFNFGFLGGLGVLAVQTRLSVSPAVQRN